MKNPIKHGILSTDGPWLSFQFDPMPRGIGEGSIWYAPHENKLCSFQGRDHYDSSSLFVEYLELNEGDCVIESAGKYDSLETDDIYWGEDLCIHVDSINEGDPTAVAENYETLLRVGMNMYKTAQCEFKESCRPIKLMFDCYEQRDATEPVEGGK